MSASGDAPGEIADSGGSGSGALLGPIRTVPVNGVELGYRQFGAGPDLVLVTGDTAPMSLWTTYLLEPLARSFRVTTFDNRGMGHSTDDPSVDLTIEVMAHDVGGLLSALELSDVTLVGWSMGGEIAISMAALSIRTERLGRIVSSGGDAGSPHTVQPPGDLLQRLADPATSDAAGLELMFPSTPDGQAAMGRFVQAMSAVPQDTPSPEILARQAQAEAGFLESSVVWDRLGDIRLPVLITNGELDPGVPVANARALAERIPGARLEIYPGAGHGMMFQDAERFAADVAHFYAATANG